VFLYSTVALLKYSFVELFLYWTAALLNCSFSEVFLYSTISLLYCCFTRLCLYFAVLKLRDSEVSQPELPLRLLQISFESNSSKSMEGHMGKWRKWPLPGPACHDIFINSAGWDPSWGGSAHVLAEKSSTWFRGTNLWWLCYPQKASKIQNPQRACTVFTHVHLCWYVDLRSSMFNYILCVSCMVKFFCLLLWCCRAFSLPITVCFMDSGKSQSRDPRSLSCKWITSFSIHNLKRWPGRDTDILAAAAAMRRPATWSKSSHKRCHLQGSSPLNSPAKLGWFWMI